MDVRADMGALRTKRQHKCNHDTHLAIMCDNLAAELYFCIISRAWICPRAMVLYITNQFQAHDSKTQKPSFGIPFSFSHASLSLLASTHH